MPTTAAPVRRWPDRVIALVAGVAAVAGWVLAESDSDDLTRPILIITGAFLVAAVTSSVLRCFTQAGGLDRTLRSLGTTSRFSSTSSAALCLPGRPVWLLPVAVLPVMALTLPIGFHSSRATGRSFP